MPERTFYPYAYLDEGIKLDFESVELDGAPVPIPEILDTPTRQIELSSRDDWQECAIQVAVVANGELGAVLWDDEDVDTLDAVLTISCKFTRSRGGVRLERSGDGWVGHVKIIRERCWGACDLVGFLVRNRSALRKGSGMAANRGDRVASSATWKVYIDDKHLLPGGDVDILWRSFKSAAESELRQQAGCYYALDLADESRPKLFLNDDFAELKSALMSKARRGRSAYVRDTLTNGILQNVLTAMAIEAVHADADTLDELDGWRKGLINTLSRHMYPGYTREAAAEKMWDMGKDSDSRATFLFHLAFGVQKHLSARDKAVHLIRAIEEDRNGGDEQI